MHALASGACGRARPAASQSTSMRNAARSCLTVGTDPGWLSMYAAITHGLELLEARQPAIVAPGEELRDSTAVRRARVGIPDLSRKELDVAPASPSAGNVDQGRLVANLSQREIDRL